jgi:hypothetical protein
VNAFEFSDGTVFGFSDDNINNSNENEHGGYDQDGNSEASQSSEQVVGGGGNLFNLFGLKGSADFVTIVFGTDLCSADGE